MTILESFANELITSHAAAISLLDVLQRRDRQRIFIHDNAAVGVPSFDAFRSSAGHHYAERALLLAQPGDVVVVTRPVDAAFLGYLHDLGVGPGAEAIVSLDGTPCTSAVPLLALLERADSVARIAERVVPGRDLRLSSYYASRDVHRVARDLAGRTGADVVVEGGTPEAVALANRKDLVREQALALQVPLAPGELVTWTPDGGSGQDPASAIMAAVDRCSTATGAAFVRSVWSLQGVDNLKVVAGQHSRATIESWLGERPTQCSYLVEPLLPVHASPNVQLWIEDDGQVDLLAVTAQRLNDNLAHYGNEYPHVSSLSEEIAASAMDVAQWLAGQQFRGPVGIDFIETPDPETGRQVHLFAEVNGRINGATYALGLFERLNQRREELSYAPLESWRTSTVQLPGAHTFETLAELMGDLIYTTGDDWGIVPYNTGLLRYGHTYVLMVAPSAEALDGLERETMDRAHRLTGRT